MTGTPHPSLQLEPKAREQLWRHVERVIEDYADQVSGMAVAPELSPEKIRASLASCTFEHAMDPLAAVDFVARGLTQFQVHTSHPRYFGLFNPAPTTLGIAADTLVAAFNPQMAAWSHSPFAAEVEAHLVRALGARLGYSQTDGTFCSGGAEANHTALLTALTHAFPEYLADGTRGLSRQPVFYVSGESHHSLLKAARLTGIGSAGVRTVPVDDSLKMRLPVLQDMIRQDRRQGLAPFMIAATAGTTNAGAIDPLPETGAIAAEEKLWYHVDAAWGGAAALVPELRHLLDGIHLADSITFDAHKWLSVPMGAGVYFTRHPEILSTTFRTQNAYMPRDAAGLEIVDPYQHSMQWSRRFIGLKVFLSLLTAGWDGYASAIRHQTAMGALLRNELHNSGWTIENETELPVVCFSHPGDSDAQAIARRIVTSGQAWISTTSIKDHSVLRACITHHSTQPEDVRALVSALNEVAVPV
jgi:glutamate/tyrosine decarboxylase-like PLP-dependent enzyme